MLVQERSEISIQLLVSPILSEDDAETLQSVADPERRSRVLQDLADGIVEDALSFLADADGDLQRRHRLLAWMVASGKLEIRFAFARHTRDSGLFHEKIGVFDFPWGDRVAFTGSANESQSGHRANYESIDVFRSWLPADAERVQTKESQFDEAWEERAQGLEILRLSQEAMMRIQRRARVNGPDVPCVDAEPDSSKGRWRHQDEAIQEFLKAERGVLEMATGTGKTRTALRILEHLAKVGEIQTAIVAADGNDLLDQWYRSLLPVARRLDYTVTRRYGKHNDGHFYYLNPQQRIHLCSRQRLPAALTRLRPTMKSKVLLVHDEVHRLGSPANRRDLDGLETDIRYRLGLSATPERAYDEEGNAFIERHLGPVIFTFSLERAIRRGILAPFDYYPIEWTASDEDREKVRDVHRMAAARKLHGEPMTDEELWMRIAAVYKASPAKLPPFEVFVEDHPDFFKSCIIFVATKEYGELVLPFVYRHTLQFHTYFDTDDREVLNRFSQGQLDCLVTCHKLSEGIDVRSLKTVMLLASDRSQLETIQRIGRCLRVDPDNPRKRSKVVDLIRMPDPDSTSDPPDLDRREWLTNVSQVEPELQP